MAVGCEVRLLEGRDVWPPWPGWVRSRGGHARRGCDGLYEEGMYVSACLGRKRCPGSSGVRGR